jgi:hypothetical protein
MLHIITGLYRPKLLKLIHESLPDAPDITWHIGMSLDKELDYVPADLRVKIYKIDCEDKESWTKRQKCLDKVDNGYYCFLDDDTIFHHQMYNEYKRLKSSNYKGMIIGEQVFKDGRRRLKPATPMFCQIDIGNVLSHHSVNQHVKFPVELKNKSTARDYEYWKDVYEFYKKQAVLVYKTISIYNGLR